MSEIPHKSEYRVGEVCQYTDTQPYVLRFWESEFPQLTPRKNRSGHRVYSREDVDLILRIKRLLYDEECTIDGARKRLDEESEVWSAGVEEKAEETAPAAARARTLLDDPPPAVDSAPASTDTVERDRYDNAVREIQRLRAEIQSLQEDLDEQRARIRQVERTADERRARTAAAVQRLESLLERIGKGSTAGK